MKLARKDYLLYRSQIKIIQVKSNKMLPKRKQRAYKRLCLVFVQHFDNLRFNMRSLRCRLISSPRLKDYASNALTVSRNSLKSQA